MLEQDIEFLPGETSKRIQVQIYDDEEPEPNEKFEIVLASPQGGLQLGEPHKGTTFILGTGKSEAKMPFYLKHPGFLYTSSLAIFHRLRDSHIQLTE